MIRFILHPSSFILLGALCAHALAQEPPRPAELLGKTEIDHTEITRRGDLVTVTGEGMRNAGELLFTMAMAPPVDDSSQHYITVFGRGDAKTMALVKAFELDPNLAPFIASPREGQLPWAHFNFYRVDDPTQQWRLKEFAIEPTAALPVVIVQPPRDGSFGGIIKAKDARGKDITRMVVIDRVDAVDIQSTGAAAALRRRLTAAVKLWNDKLAASGFVPPAKVVRRFTEGDSEQGEHSRARQLAKSNSHGQTPAFPWGPQTPPPATPINPVFPPGGPAVDPTPAPSAPNLLPFLIKFLPSLQTVLMLLLTFSNVWMLYREIARQTGIPLLLDDATAAKLLDLLRQLNAPKS